MTAPRLEKLNNKAHDMSKQKRMKPEARKEDILAAAIPLAERMIYSNVTRADVGAAAGVSGPAVQYHFHTMGQFRTELMRYAVKHECLQVVAQGIVTGDPQALKASDDLKRRAVASL